MNSHHDYKTCIEELYEVEGKGMRSKHSLSVGSQLISLIQTDGALCQRRVSEALHGRRKERCHHTLACSSSVIARGGRVHATCTGMLYDVEKESRTDRSTRSAPTKSLGGQFDS